MNICKNIYLKDLKIVHFETVLNLTMLIYSVLEVLNIFGNVKILKLN